MEYRAKRKLARIFIGSTSAASLLIACSGRTIDSGSSATPNAGSGGGSGVSGGGTYNNTGGARLNGSGGMPSGATSSEPVTVRDGGLPDSGPPPAPVPPITISYRDGKSTIDVFVGIHDNDGGPRSVTDLTTDAAGNAWFTATDSIGRMTPSGVVTLFPVREEPVAGYPWSIVTGSDGDLWFSRSDGVNLTRVTTAGVMTEFPLPATPISWLSGPTLAAGGDGIWFSAQEFGYIGMMVSSGVIEKIPIPTSYQSALAVGTDEVLWFDSSYSPDDGGGFVGQISRLSLGGPRSKFPVTAIIQGPMAVDRTESLWFAEGDSHKLARLTPQGALQEIAIQRGVQAGSLDASPNDLTTDKDGNVWFPEPLVPAVAKIDVTTGVMTEFSVSDPDCGSCVMPIRLAVAKDGIVWFTRAITTGADQSPKTIGRLTPSQ